MCLSAGLKSAACEWGSLCVQVGRNICGRWLGGRPHLRSVGMLHRECEYTKQSF
jgi:hypothetical protein